MRTKTRPPHQRRSTTPLSVEQLEDRRVPAVYTLTDLGTLGGLSAQAHDLNEAGQVVGSSTTAASEPHAFRWQDGVMTDLGVLPGEQDSGASAVNSHGHVVGTSGRTDPETYEITSRSFLYAGTTLIDLGVPSFRSSATDINDHGHVVGTMRAAGGFTFDHAYIYENGVVADLNTRIPAGSGLTLAFAYAINNAGQIVGLGRDAAGNNRAFLLTPMPPDTPVISLGDATVTEGNTGTRTATFTVTVSPAAGQPVAVHYGTANGTAVAGSDYQGRSGTLTFAPGETSKTIGIVVNGDRTAEWDETFRVTLSQATGAVLVDAQGVGTIADDEPRISIDNVIKREGHSGTTLFVFTVSLSAAADVPVSVRFSTANGDAQAGEDYVAKSGILAFAPGETSKAISIAVKGDRKSEFDETFYINLSNAVGGMILDSLGYGVIQSDDSW
jgi:probable HAF family extracellular repeat protein